jgi:hypothetical protein
LDGSSEIEARDRSRHLAAARHDQHEPGEHESDRREVILVGEEAAALNSSGRAIFRQSGGFGEQSHADAHPLAACDRLRLR